MTTHPSPRPPSFAKRPHAYHNVRPASLNIGPPPSLPSPSPRSATNFSPRSANTNSASPRSARRFPRSPCTGTMTHMTANRPKVVTTHKRTGSTIQERRCPRRALSIETPDEFSSEEVARAIKTAREVDAVALSHTASVSRTGVEKALVSAGLAPPPSARSPQRQLKFEQPLVCEAFREFPLMLELQRGPDPTPVVAPSLLAIPGAAPATTVGAPEFPAGSEPLFLVHPGAGFATPYMHLGPLGRKVYGISNSFLAAGLKFKSVRHAARLYLNEVRAMQPEGPYVLGGWSFGGVCAREMAAILAEDWAKEEERYGDDLLARMSDEEAKEWDRRHRVSVYMMDSFNPQFRPPVAVKRVDSPSSSRTASPDKEETDTRTKAGLRVPTAASLSSAMPASPFDYSAADKSISTNAALKTLAGSTVAHLREQYRVATVLLRQHEPSVVPRAGVVSGDRDDYRVRVHLLKAGKLGALPKGIKPAQRIQRTKQHCCKRNGWTAEDVVPGLANEGATQTVGYTHDDMFSSKGCEEATRWLEGRLRAEWE